MFPTTVWTTIRRAGDEDDAALERFARAYRAPVLRYIRGRGFAPGDAEDLCQEVFLRILNGRVLERADARHGRFRSLLLSVTRHVIVDRARRRSETPVANLEPVDRDPDFDREWALELTWRAIDSLRQSGSRYHEVLSAHLDGKPTDRQKLWIARRKLAELIRADVARTCGSHEEFEAEVSYLSRYLRPRKNETDRGGQRTTG